MYKFYLQNYVGDKLPYTGIQSSYPHYRMMEKGYKSKKHSKLIVR